MAENTLSGWGVVVSSIPPALPTGCVQDTTESFARQRKCLSVQTTVGTRNDNARVLGYGGGDDSSVDNDGDGDNGDDGDGDDSGGIAGDGDDSGDHGGHDSGGSDGGDGGGGDNDTMMAL